MNLRTTILIAALGLTGCANASAGESNFTQAQADAITEKCEAPKGILWVEGDSGVRFDPPLDLSYDVSACILQEIKKSGVTKFGFVGNERSSESQEPKQQLTLEQAAELETICDLPAGALTGTTPIADIREAAPKIACAVAEAQKRNLTVGFISNPVDPDAQTH